MEKMNEILANYEVELEKLNEEAKKYDNQDNYTDFNDGWREKQKEEVYSKATGIQAKAKESYIEAVEAKKLEVESQIDIDIPNILNEQLSFTQDELNFLAKKYEGNYFANKKIQKIAEDNDYIVEINTTDPFREMKKLQNKLDGINNTFGTNPMNDTQQARVEQAMGIR